MDSFARSAQLGCVMCSDFPFHDDAGQINKVKRHGFFTIFWISYEYDIPCMTVDSGHGLKTVSLVKGKIRLFLQPGFGSVYHKTYASLQPHNLSMTS